jgi:hypothetical protein
MAAAVQRNAIEGELQRFTLRVTRRTVPIMFSMMFVQASERRSSDGNPKDLVQSLQNTFRDAGGVALQALAACRTGLWQNSNPLILHDLFTDGKNTQLQENQWVIA